MRRGKLTIRRRERWVDVDGIITGSGYEVLLNDISLDGCLTDVSLTLDVDKIPRATLGLRLDDLDVDATALAALQAVYEQRKAAEGEGG